MQPKSAAAESFEHAAATDGTPTGVKYRIVAARSSRRRSFLLQYDNVRAESDCHRTWKLRYAYENWNGQRSSQLCFWGLA